MSVSHHESILETCYDEAWIDYAKEHGLTYDQLTALEQNSDYGILPADRDWETDILLS